MKTKIWMPVYVGDYMADTIGLTLSQHGAYFLSLMAYWRKGDALSSDELKEICGREIDRVSQFFVLLDGRWHHKRVDKELEISRIKSEKARESSMKGVAARLQMASRPDRNGRVVKLLPIHAPNQT